MSDDVKMAIRLWRVALTTLELRDLEYSRTLESFRELPPSYTVEFDASLWGLGIVLFKVDESGKEIAMTAIKIKLPFDLHGDPSYQNTAEFIGALMGLASLVYLGLEEIAIRVRGDSVSALSWVSDMKFGEKRSRRAAIVYIMLLSTFGLHVPDQVHLPGEDNWVCDGLSRDKDPAELGFTDEMVLDVSKIPVLSEILGSLDPTDLIETEGDMRGAFASAPRMIQRLSMDRVLPTLHAPVYPLS